VELAGRRNPGTVNENDLNNNFSKFLQSLGKNVERKQLKIPSHRSSGAYVTQLARHRPASRSSLNLGQEKELATEFNMLERELHDFCRPSPFVFFFLAQKPKTRNAKK
jgi:hypothetical protein